MEILRYSYSFLQQYEYLILISKLCQLDKKIVKKLAFILCIQKKKYEKLTKKLSSL